MFKQNKYTKIYGQIIQRANNRTLLDSYEEHHIIPRCLGGSDDISNLCKLTPREHFICHHLLTKMHDSYKLKFAFSVMLCNNPFQQRDYIITSRTYETLKIFNAQAAIERNRNRVYLKGYKCYYNDKTDEHLRLPPGTQPPAGFRPGVREFKRDGSNGNKGRQYWYHPETKQVKKFGNGEFIPEGWFKGNPNADTSATNGLRGSSYYFNPITGEERRVQNPPPGWVKGRSIVWVTNGSEEKQINIRDIGNDAEFKRGRKPNYNKKRDSKG